MHATTIVIDLEKMRSKGLLPFRATIFSNAGPNGVRFIF